MCVKVPDFYSSKERIFKRERERKRRPLAPILLQKLNVPAEPIAPDLHLCKMNIGNYYMCACRGARICSRNINQPIKSILSYVFISKYRETCLY